MTIPPARSQISVTLDGSGPPVLLLHGLGGDHTQSLGLLPDDLRATRIAPELPGHGATDLLDTEPVGFTPFTRLVAASIDRLHGTGRIPGKPMPVVGISMGAGIAVTLAATRPELVSSLTLIRPAWLDVSSPPNLAPYPIVAQLLRDLGPSAGAAAFRNTATYQRIERQAPAMGHSLLSHSPETRPRRGRASSPTCGRAGLCRHAPTTPPSTS